MLKNMFKEIIFVLLLTVAIIIVLAILLYEYVPVNKILPEKIAYVTPEDVQIEIEEIEEELAEPLEITYHVDATDLNNYKTIKEYVPGKKNPFSATEVIRPEANDDGNVQPSAGNNNSNTNSNNTTKPQENSSSNNGSSSNSNTGYLPDRGTK